MRHIFITGASGCVGHYVVAALSKSPDNYLYLLVRDPKKLKFDPRIFPNIKIIPDDLKNITRYQYLLDETDMVIHLAADWAEKVGNYDYTLDFFSLLKPEKCKKVLYFSTASILGSDGQPVIEAETHGTNYVQSKYRLHQKLKGLAIYPNVITLFPTWVLGGDANHPYSHASAGINSLTNWLWLLRFFTVDVSFHYIHAADIAKITKYLLDHEVAERSFILGNKPISASQFIKELCAAHHLPVYFQINISLPFILLLAKITGKKLQPWDLYCFGRRRFVFNAVNADSFLAPRGIEPRPRP